MKLLLTTILMIVCLVAYGATPSYSNFSSNQFAPSATYTVTVKNQPKLTNIIEHAQLSLTNPAFANSLIYITNMTSTNGMTNGMLFVGQYGPQVQFAWRTNGIGTTNTVMVISNGMVGIGKANPTVALDVTGTITASGNSTADGYLRAGGTSSIGWNGQAQMFSLKTGNINIGDFNDFSNFSLTFGGAASLSTSWRSTNFPALALGSVSNGNPSFRIQAGTNNNGMASLEVLGGFITHSNNCPITANFANLAPCGCITWNSNGTFLLICTNSISGLCYTNKLGGL